jgi:hypothetical protein
MYIRTYVHTYVRTCEIRERDNAGHTRRAIIVVVVVVIVGVAVSVVVTVGFHVGSLKGQR